MAMRPQQPDASIAELSRLLKQGVLGFYTHFEAIEIFGYLKGKPPINVFSILVAEEREADAGHEPIIVGPRLKLKSLRDWTFGIQRSLRPIAELLDVFKTFQASGEWKPSGKQLHVGGLIPVATQFVPSDTTVLAPLNNVLKNNFWNGSYLIEWADPMKADLQSFFEEPPRLQELSDGIQKSVPIRIASLSDRLGHVLVQLPITTIQASFGSSSASGDSNVTVQWHPKATRRSLRASCEMQFDHMISGFASAEIGEGSATLPTAAGDGMLRGLIWDGENHVILAATGSTAFIQTIALNMNVINPEPRVFLRTSTSGPPTQVRVGVQRLVENTVGTPRSDRDGGWTRRRIYQNEAAQLAAERVFVQYKPVSGRQEAEHGKALSDLRLLIARHGQRGVWLWDPFLSAEDILDTLFHCPYLGAELWALTAAQDIPIRTLLASPEPESEAPKPSFAERQRAAITAAQSNLLGLNLEYRAKVGQAGWAFHDRFLIFPHVENGALAWSLGTSVNSLGKQHHILQRVDDGQLVADAFKELWIELDQPEHLIWKTP